MLDTITKKRIDDCRDILVGKLPDPKSQIEQITIALIYKFMDDMDKEAIELGGEAKFFTGAYEKFAWDALFDAKVQSAEMLQLYMSAIESMEKNPNIPQLFRDIFKNAYLPYRDLETLRLFLKTIGEFEYTHSEKLGDAFEYLLQVMGSQGDAGQFRTPRHIIDFLVKIVDPGKNDKILDPACGTAGFLISAFKHIKEKNNNQLTPDERRKLIQNFVGYDISPDMVRLSLVNLYLHGFSDPHIVEYDTLSSEERWDESYDVILANPPFMSPKGGIRPHKKFTIQSKRSEVLFVDYIAEHLSVDGKAGIIVPEGIIFQSGTSYKDLRKMLVESSLWAVVSLPSGVFNPYSGVKTSILLLDKALAKKTDKILFVKIENDGFGLGAQRRPISKGNQLPITLDIINDYKLEIEQGKEFDFSNISIAHSVLKEKIREAGDFNLSGERYKDILRIESNFDLVSLSDDTLFEIVSGGTPSSKIPDYWGGNINWATLVDLSSHDFISSIDSTARKITVEGLKKSSARLLPPNSILISTRATIGRIGINTEQCSTNQGFKNIIVKNATKVNYYYVALMMTNLVDKMNAMATGGTFKELSKRSFETLQIPLPPLSVQEEIVAEIVDYQKIIDGARMVVEHYRPQIKIDPEWEMVELGEYVKIQTGGTPSKSNNSFWEGDIPWVSPKDMKVDFIGDAKDHITKEAVQNSSTKIVEPGTILIVVRSGILKHTLPVALTINPVSFNQDIISIKTDTKKILSTYLFYYLKSTSKVHLLRGIKPGVTVQSFHNGYFKRVEVPIPPLDIQKNIILQMEREADLIKSNRELIKIFEQRIKDRISEVWGMNKNED